MSYMTYEMKLQEMQEFGYNKGKIETTLSSIKNLMKNLNISAEAAMKALDISPSEYKHYLLLL